MIAWLSDDTPFPPLERALHEPNGLLAASADVTPDRILVAYARGIYPWYSHDQPVLWWSPDPRMVLYTDNFVVSRSLRRRLRQRTFDVRVNTSFDEVVTRCATAPRNGQAGTWITTAMQSAYIALHQRGYAHCVESWQDGVLVGGLYGLLIGRVFFGESMFAERPDASKVALATLVAMLRSMCVPLIDCQQETAHLASLGARPISRRSFARQLGELIDSNASPGMLPSPVSAVSPS